MAKNVGKKVAGLLIGATVIPILVFIILGAILQLNFIWDMWRPILSISVLAGSFIGYKWIL